MLLPALGRLSSRFDSAHRGTLVAVLLGFTVQCCLQIEVFLLCMRALATQAARERVLFIPSLFPTLRVVLLLQTHCENWLVYQVGGAVLLQSGFCVVWRERLVLGRAHRW